MRMYVDLDRRHVGAAFKERDTRYLRIPALDRLSYQRHSAGIFVQSNRTLVSLAVND